MIKKFTEQDMQNYADYVAKAVLSNITPNLDRWYAEWHKPTKKVIDLSVLIESGIDCEFKDDISERTTIGKLLKITNDDSYPYKTRNSRVDGYDQCKPRMNHKHAWQGGECPLPEGFEVKVWLRGGGDSAIYSSAKGEAWAWNYRPQDIMAFEVLGLADGYVMPWEQDNE